MSKTYQATDLARDHRSIMEQARSGQARIRDKDGTTLAMLPLNDLEITQQVSHWSLIALRIERMDQAQRVPLNLGDLAWLSYLDEQEFQEFIEELRNALFLVSSNGDMGPLDNILYSWRATATLNADPDLSEQLISAVSDEDDLILFPSRG